MWQSAPRLVNILKVKFQLTNRPQLHIATLTQLGITLVSSSSLSCRYRHPRLAALKNISLYIRSRGAHLSCVECKLTYGSVLTQLFRRGSVMLAATAHTTQPASKVTSLPPWPMGGRRGCCAVQTEFAVWERSFRNRGSPRAGGASPGEAYKPDKWVSSEY